MTSQTMKEMRINNAQTTQLITTVVADVNIIVKLHLVIWMAVFISVVNCHS